MNKQSNLYTIIYIIVIVVIVGSALAFTAMSLRPRQQVNANADKMRQILMAVHIPSEGSDVATIFERHITAMLTVDSEGAVVSSAKGFDPAIFSIDVASQSKIADPSGRELPVYVCVTDDNAVKYILPVAGNGLWGPIWGYVAVDSDGSTIYGAYFSHEGETPGLGAEIEKPAFQDEFIGKRLVKNGSFMPIAVVKAGQTPSDGADYVDGVSGGTITSKGVGAMLDNCLSPYARFLSTLGNGTID